jgi:YfiH family protein
MIAQPGISALEKLGPPRDGPGLLAASSRLLVSPLLASLGVRHGFSTRMGGVSTGRYATLNLGETWGDDLERVTENLRRVGDSGGFTAAALCQVQQVHGTTVAIVNSVEKRQRQADGMATGAPLCLGVYSADCVGMLLSDGEGRVAAVHAGWRGTVQGIAAEAVRALEQLGAAAARVRVALGPSIGPCCFEVQEDVATHFRALCEGALEVREGGRMFGNLRRVNRHFLERSGVLPEHIDDAPPCTHCDAQRFFSFRRDGAGIGQHLAFIVGGGS